MESLKKKKRKEMGKKWHDLMCLETKIMGDITSQLKTPH